MGSTPRLDLTRDVLNLPSTPCTLKLMICFPRLRTLKRNPRRLWLMLPVLLMNLELNKSTLDNKRRQNALLNLKSGNWKLNSAVAKARLLIPSRDSRRPSVASRSSNSNWMKTTRTKTACLNWLENSNKRSRPTRNRLRKQRKSLPSTWLSIARPNKSLKRPKSVPNWLETLSPLPVLLPLVCKCKKIKDFAPLSSSSKHQRPNCPNQAGTRSEILQQLMYFQKYQD